MSDKGAQVQAQEDLLKVHGRIRKAVATVARRELQLTDATAELEAALVEQGEITERVRRGSA